MFTFTFLIAFVAFYQKNVFLSVSFLFMMKYSRRIIKQSETGISDKKLSVGILSYDMLPQRLKTSVNHFWGDIIFLWFLSKRFQNMVF